jgi:L-ribulose-5-phosphate 3-epimerase
MRLGVSSYSYWHFRGEPFPLEEVLEEAARLELAGVEILERQLGAEAGRARLLRLRRQALTLGLDLYGLATHQDFVSPDPDERAQQVRRTVHSLEVAAELGAPCIRLNSGRWKTLGDFDALMAAGGVEPPLPGHSEDDAFAWCIGCIEALLPHAERLGVMLALENHWGLTARAAGVRRILAALPSPYLAALLDTGNTLRRPGVDMYAEMQELAPLAVLVHAKAYHGGGEWYDLDIDYRRVAAILREAGYRGYVSLEFEGRAPARTGVPAALAALRAAGL